MRAYDLINDQSFFLCHLKNSILPFIEFPIGNMMKSDVKRLANEMNLERIAQKNESNLIKFFN
jgi:tRNA-specific 2-thiouridylase